jgi:hypothetical protein
VPSVTVALEDHSDTSWRITVYAELLLGHLAYLGQVVTYPPGSQKDRYRVVCQASCPGAKRWTIEIAPDRVPTPVNLNRAAFITVAASPDLLVPGVSAVLGASVLVGDRFGVTGGQLTLAGQTVTIDPTPTGVPRRIVKLSVFETGSGGTVSLASAWFPSTPTPPVLLPPNGANTWDFGSGTPLPVSLTTATFPIAVSPGGWTAEYRW